MGQTEFDSRAFLTSARSHVTTRRVGPRHDATAPADPGCCACCFARRSAFRAAFLTLREANVGSLGLGSADADSVGTAPRGLALAEL